LRKIIDHDPVTGISHVFYYDNETDEATITAEQNVDDVVEENKQLYNDAPTNWNDDWNRVAQIPMVVYWDLKRKGILDDQVALKRWLNDPENRFFRTRPGTI